MLERFYQGRTTLEEEQWLQDYFSSSAVPDEFFPDRDLFTVFQTTEDAMKIPGDLDQKILAKLEGEERRELRSRRITIYSLSGLAAGLLALIAVYLFFLRNEESPLLASQQWEDTYEDPLQAYEEAKKTLLYVSNKLNQGTGELKHVQQVSRTTTDPLRSLSKINKGTRELNLLGELQKVREIEN